MACWWPEEGGVLLAKGYKGYIGMTLERITLAAGRGAGKYQNG